MIEVQKLCNFLNLVFVNFSHKVFEECLSYISQGTDSSVFVCDREIVSLTAEQQ